MKNLLYFYLDIDFGDKISLLCNNEVDLENHLLSLGYTNIKFYDLKENYGTCTFKTKYGHETAKCYYIKKI